MTEKKENAPDEHFNGTMAVRFMEDNFQFSAKETGESYSYILS